MSDFKGLERAVTGIIGDLDGSSMRGLTTRVAVLAKGDYQKEVVRDLGSDMKFSGWGKFKVASGFELINNHSAELAPRPAGPAWVLERGRKAKAQGLPKRKRSKVYRTPWGLRTATKASPFRRGGTRGKATFERATRTMQRETPERISKEIDRMLIRRLGG